VENIPAGGKSGEILIWPVLHRFALALFPTPNGTAAENQEKNQCPAEFDYCVTLHCQALSTFHTKNAIHFIFQNAPSFHR
jgi:hypothetical protein